MYALEYHIDRHGRLSLAGLTFEETAEFRALDSVAGGPAELRWLELFNKHEHAKLAPQPPAAVREKQLELL